MTREEVIEWFKMMKEKFENTKYEDALNMAIEALEQEEIIRCKDCKFNKGKYKCFNPKSVAIFPDENDYCSYAERMESDE